MKHILVLTTSITLFLAGCGAPQPVVDGPLTIPPSSPGGWIPSFMRTIEQHRNQIIVMDGEHFSASTLWLKLPHVCATDTALFGFHGPWPVTPNYPRTVAAVADMYAQRSPELAAWFVDRFGDPNAGDVSTLEIFTRDELNTLFDARITPC